MNEIPPRTKAKDHIIFLLISNESMTFSQLQKTLKLSRPALSRHLSTLLKEGVISFTKIGREKHYKIQKGRTTLERSLVIFSTHYTQDFLWNLEEGKYKTSTIAYKKISDALSAYFLYLILKSLKTGKNWLEGFDVSRMAMSSMNLMLSILFKTKPAPITALTPYTKEILDNTFKEMNAIIKDRHAEKKLEDMIKEFQKTYPQESKVIDFIMNEFVKES